MERHDRTSGQAAESGFEAYRGAVRRQWKLVVLVAAAAFLVALAWTVVRSPKYEATATLLASPLPATNETFIGIDVLRESADSTRTIQTAAALLDTREAADRTATAVGGGLTARDVQDLVSVEPVGQTNIIDVIAQDDTAPGAANLANAYVKAALSLRRERIRQQVASVIDDVRGQLKDLPADSGAAAELRARLPQLVAVRNGVDPSLAVGQQATPPDSDSTVPAALLLIMSLIVGLVAGVGVAIWADATRRRVATHGELLAAYPLPVLAQVPLPPRVRGLRQAHSSPLEPTVHAAEAYRSVLAQMHRRERTTLLVTSASPDDGKTHVVVGLAMVAAASGLRVALVDFDLRSPEIGDLFRIPASYRVPAAQSGAAASREGVLVDIESAPGLSVLAFRNEPLTSLGLETSLSNAASLIGEIGRGVDVVIVDTPPLGEVTDALRIAAQADEVVVVARPDHTSLAAFGRMRDLLERSGHPASGLVVVGAQDGAPSGYPYGTAGPAFGSSGRAMSSR